MDLIKVSEPHGLSGPGQLKVSSQKCLSPGLVSRPLQSQRSLSWSTHSQACFRQLKLSRGLFQFCTFSKEISKHNQTFLNSGFNGINQGSYECVIP